MEVPGQSGHAGPARWSRGETCSAGCSFQQARPGAHRRGRSLCSPPGSAFTHRDRGGNPARVASAPRWGSLGWGAAGRGGRPAGVGENVFSRAKARGSVRTHAWGLPGERTVGGRLPELPAPGAMGGARAQVCGLQGNAEPSGSANRKRTPGGLCGHPDPPPQPPGRAVVEQREKTSPELSC